MAARVTRLPALFVLLLALAAVACGGIPIGPSPGAPADSAAATASPASTGTVAAGAAAPRSSRAGLAVVAVGKISYSGDAGGRTAREGAELVRATHSLAKQLYSIPRLRPRTDEATVTTLAGGEPPSNAAPALGEVAELRAGLSSDLGATTRALLESLARRIDVEGIVVVTYSLDRGALAHLFHVDALAGGGLSTRLDGAMFSASEKPSPSQQEPSVFVWDAGSVASLLGPAPTAFEPSNPGPTSSHAGDERPGESVPSHAANPPLAPVRKDASTLPKPKTGAAKPDDKKKSKTIFESPWFWVAAGAVAAIGVTALVVSQTVDTSTGTIHVQGKVLP